MKVSVSYLKSIYSIEKTIQKIEESTADYIHIDLMDGIFVKEKTEDLEKHYEILKTCKKPLDIHLMMDTSTLPREIDRFAKLKPKSITIPIEIENVSDMIKKIKSYSIECGLSLNPDTNILEVLPYLCDLDIILIMSVYPGRGGQAFIPNTIQKLKEVKEMKRKKNQNFKISIDGGMNKETSKEVKDYVDILVSGSYVCMHKDMNSQIENLK